MENAEKQTAEQQTEIDWVHLFHELETEIQRDVSADVEYLCHYTTPDGFLGITNGENLTLRFSQYDFLNDVSEGRDIFEQYYRALDVLLSEGKITVNFYEFAKTYTAANTARRSLWRYNPDADCYEEQSMPHRTFICCLSEADDSLSMWNGYSANGAFSGFSLGLDPGEILSLGEGNAQVMSFAKDMCGNIICFDSIDRLKKENAKSIAAEFASFKVIYDNRKKQEILQKYIQKIFICTKQNRHFSEILLTELLLLYKPVFKKECFAHEKEFRLAIHLPEGDEAFSNTAGIFKTRARGLYMIPYVDVTFKKSCLMRVRLCPTANYEDVRYSISDYLQRSNYKDVEICPSACPVRY